MDLGNLLALLISFYSYVIFVYVLMSWFPMSGIVGEVYSALATICEPFLGIFRRVIPPIGMMDISPIVAFFVLRLLATLIANVL